MGSGVREKPRMLLLQAGRGVAANLVLLSHLYIVEQKYFTAPMMPAVSHLGIAGVDFFFVLSGFIMAAVAGRQATAGRFLWNRATRIYPSYWAVTLIVLIVASVRPDMVNASVHGEISLWRSFALFPSDSAPLLAVGWTLIYEVYFYLVFAGILALRISVGSGLAAWVACYAAMGAFMPTQMRAYPLVHLVTDPLNLEFIAGAAIGLAWTRTRLPFKAVAGVAALALAPCALYIAARLDLPQRADLDSLRVPLFGIVSALIVYWLAAIEQQCQRKVPLWLTRTGDWSYATYLSHVLILSALGRLIDQFTTGGVGAAVMIPIAVVAANAVGGLVHIFLERPTIGFLHGLKWRLALTRVTSSQGSEKGYSKKGSGFRVQM